MDEMDMRAAEFVLGTLDEDERRAIQALRLVDPKLAAAIDYWEGRLAPLADSIAPVPPPADLWHRIEAQLPAVRLGLAGADAPMPSVSRSLALWRGTAIGALALAAGLAGILLFAHRPGLETAGISYATAIADQQSHVPTWFAETQADGSIAVTALAKIDRPSGKDLELWALAADARRPVSLGVLPASGRYVVPSDRLGRRDHLKLLVTLEQAGGSPTGQPTTTPIYAGELAATS